MDLVPPEAIMNPMDDVNAHLKASYPLFNIAFDSPAFYYDNSKPIKMVN